MDSNSQEIGNEQSRLYSIPSLREFPGQGTRKRNPYGAQQTPSVEETELRVQASRAPRTVEKEGGAQGHNSGN